MAVPERSSIHDHHQDDHASRRPAARRKSSPRSSRGSPVPPSDSLTSIVPVEIMPITLPKSPDRSRPCRPTTGPGGRCHADFDPPMPPVVSRPRTNTRDDALRPPYPEAKSTSSTRKRACACACRSTSAAGSARSKPSASQPLLPRQRAHASDPQLALRAGNRRRPGGRLVNRHHSALRARRAKRGSSGGTEAPRAILRQCQSFPARRVRAPRSPTCAPSSGTASRDHISAHRSPCW